MRLNVGFLVCGLSLVLDDLASGSIVLPFPADHHLVAPHPYRVRVRPDIDRRPQLQRFLNWLRETARDTSDTLDRITAPRG